MMILQSKTANHAKERPCHTLCDDLSDPGITPSHHTELSSHPSHFCSSEPVSLHQLGSTTDSDLRSRGRGALLAWPGQCVLWALLVTLTLCRKAQGKSASKQLLHGLQASMRGRRATLWTLGEWATGDGDAATTLGDLVPTQLTHRLGISN